MVSHFVDSKYALLCNIVVSNKRKQGTGPKGDEVLPKTGGFSLIQPNWAFVTEAFDNERTASRLTFDRKSGSRSD